MITSLADIAYGPARDEQALAGCNFTIERLDQDPSVRPWAPPRERFLARLGSEFHLRLTPSAGEPVLFSYDGGYLTAGPRADQLLIVCDTVLLATISSEPCIVAVTPREPRYLVRTDDLLLLQSWCTVDACDAAGLRWTVHFACDFEPPCLEADKLIVPLHEVVGGRLVIDLASGRYEHEPPHPRRPRRPWWRLGR